MVTCSMCGTRRYDHGYDDGSVDVCYSCTRWGPPKSKEVRDLEDEVKKLREEIEFLKRRRI